jgi:hypothetical protein
MKSALQTGAIPVLCFLLGCSGKASDGSQSVEEAGWDFVEGCVKKQTEEFNIGILTPTDAQEWPAQTVKEKLVHMRARVQDGTLRDANGRELYFLRAAPAGMRGDDVPGRQERRHQAWREKYETLQRRYHVVVLQTDHKD